MKEKVNKLEEGIPIKETKYCPTMGGTIYGYKPQYKEHDGTWKDIPIHRKGTFGVPWPLGDGGILSTIFLLGYDQAWALAFSFSAQAVATTGVFEEVRVVEYEVLFDIKAKELEAHYNLERK